MKKLAARCDYGSVLEVSDDVFAGYGVALSLLRRIHIRSGENQAKIRSDSVRRAYVGLLLVKERNAGNDRGAIEAVADEVQARWRDFHAFCERRYYPTQFSRLKKGKQFFDTERYLHSNNLKADVLEFFSQAVTTPATSPPQSV
jgi:hypothetical protein